MSKICGLVTKHPGATTTDGLNDSYDASWHEGYVQKEKWQNGRAGLGHFSVGAVNTESQPIFDASKRDAVVYCGKIFDTLHHRDSLSKSGVRFQHQDNDAELLLNLFNHSGREMFREINGIFSMAVWNAEDERLTLVNDRYGLRSLYYYHDASRGVFVFSSELRGVVDSGVVEPKINWSACSNFLYLGHHLGDSTWFSGVQLMPPGSVLTFENNEVRIEPYWDFNSIEIDDRIDYPTALEESNRLFTQAIRRQNVPTDGSKAVFLSGGLDSRRIAAELKKQGGDFETFTTGWDDTCADPKVACQVSAALGVKNTLIPVPQQSLIMEYWPRSNALVDYETKLHQWIIPLVEALPKSVKVNYDGLAGDIPFNGMARASEFFQPERFAWAQSADVRTLAKLIVGPALNLGFLSSSLQRQISYEQVVDSVRAELSQYGNTRNRLTYYYLMNRTRRSVALSALRLLTLRVETFFPFLDNDLFEFVMSISPELKMSHQLRNDMLNTSYPELLNMATAEDVAVKNNNAPWQLHPVYIQQRRKYYLRNLRHQYLGMNWAFNNSQAGPRVLVDLLLYYMKRRHISYMYNEGFTTFFCWLERYFPRGLK